MRADLRILVLAGGLSHERDVSLRSGRRVQEVLRDEGLLVEMADADVHLLDVVADWAPDVVFPVLHGAAGEDGGVRSVLELVGVPYVGSAPAQCRLAFDKPSASAVVRARGLHTPAQVALAHATFRELGAHRVLDALVERLGLPLVVKPAQGGSALGVTVVEESSALPAAMVAAYGYGTTAVVERFVRGVEVAVSVVDLGAGPVALPVVEIVPDGGVYDYAARYTAGSTEFFVPARLPDEVRSTAAETAVAAHRALQLRDLSRSDLIVDEQGIPWFLEVNVAPGMTETSLMPQSVGAAVELVGSAGRLYRQLVEQAAARSELTPAT